jgi:peroxiredoxin
VRHYDELKALDVQVLGVSVDPPEKARVTQQILKTPFPILSDEGQKVMNLYGTRSPVYHGRGGVPINTPTLVLIDRAGNIRWIHQAPDYKIRSPITEVLVEARKLK